MNKICLRKNMELVLSLFYIKIELRKTNICDVLYFDNSGCKNLYNTVLLANEDLRRNLISWFIFI